LIRSSCSPISKRPKLENNISHLTKPSETFKFGYIDFEETHNSKAREDVKQGEGSQLNLTDKKKLSGEAMEEEKDGNGNQMRMIGGRKRIMA